MSLASVGSGTQTAVVTTEHTLDTETTAGVYILVADLSNLVAGDTVFLRLYTKDKSGGASRLAFEAVYSGVQNVPHVYSPPVPVDTEIICTLTQSEGTSRDFDWNLLKL
jgi:hypothetical protein